MCIHLSVWFQTMSGLKFGQLANVQTVGIGLYLALAVIQGISATGVAGLQRRTNTLRAAVLGSRLRSEFTNMRRLQADVSRLEIGFQSFNRTVLWATVGLFAIALSYFAYCTVWQDSAARLTGTLFTLAFYLLLPLGIFLGSALIIWKRCADVARAVEAAEKRYWDATFK